jgi:hypothetical protein
MRNPHVGGKPDCRPELFSGGSFRSLFPFPEVLGPHIPDFGICGALAKPSAARLAHNPPRSSPKGGICFSRGREPAVKWEGSSSRVAAALVLIQPRQPALGEPSPSAAERRILLDRPLRITARLQIRVRQGLFSPAIFSGSAGSAHQLPTSRLHGTDLITGSVIRHFETRCPEPQRTPHVQSVSAPCAIRVPRPYIRERQHFRF